MKLLQTCLNTFAQLTKKKCYMRMCLNFKKKKECVLYIHVHMIMYIHVHVYTFRWANEAITARTKFSSVTARVTPEESQRNGEPSFKVPSLCVCDVCVCAFENIQFVCVCAFGRGKICVCVCAHMYVCAFGRGKCSNFYVFVCVHLKERELNFSFCIFWAIEIVCMY